MPTLCLTSAYSITASVNPPRAAFSDLPLGHTVGRPHDPEFQRNLLRRAFAAAEAMDRPGTIAPTGMSWDADGDWKRRATPTGIEAEGGLSDGGTDGNSDTRNERVDVPQYQYESDRIAAESTP
ncbi:MAG: hypothetical protein P8M16_08060 [Acidimicrobiales bacterium]|nr:hypothetical protein [Acidimicrobiales bacterium]